MPVAQSAVGTDIGVRPGQDLVDVGLDHARPDDRFGTLSVLRFPVEGLLRDLRESRDDVHLANRRNFSQRLANVVRVRLETRHPEPVGRGDLVEHLGNRLAVGVIAIGQQHHDRRLPVFVGVDIGRDIDAFGARRVEFGDHVLRAAPKPLHRQLDVRDLHRHAGLAADQDDLVDRILEPAVFAAHVTDVARAGVRGHPGASASTSEVSE